MCKILYGKRKKLKKKIKEMCKERYSTIQYVFKVCMEQYVMGKQNKVV